MTGFPKVSSRKIDNDLKVSQFGAPFRVGEVTDAMTQCFRGAIVEKVLQMCDGAARKSDVNEVKKLHGDVFGEMFAEPLPKGIVVVRRSWDEDDVIGRVVGGHCVLGTTDGCWY